MALGILWVLGLDAKRIFFKINMFDFLKSIYYYFLDLEVPNECLPSVSYFFTIPDNSLSDAAPSVTLVDFPGTKQ